MAKFCRFCGKNISETGICNCEASVSHQKATQPTQQPTIRVQSVEETQVRQTVMTKQAENTTNVQQNIQAGLNNELLTNAVNLLKEFWISPMTCIKKTASPESMNMGILLLALKALLIAIICVFLINNTIGSISSFIGSFIPGASNLLKVDTGGIFFKTFFGILMADAILIASLYAGVKIFKGYGDFRSFIGAFGTASIINTGLIIVLGLALKISIVIAVGCVFVMGYANAIYIAKAFSESFEINEERKFYAIMIGAFIYGVFITIVSKSYILNLIKDSVGLF